MTIKKSYTTLTNPTYSVCYMCIETLWSSVDAIEAFLEFYIRVNSEILTYCVSSYISHRITLKRHFQTATIDYTGYMHYQNRFFTFSIIS